MLRTLFIVGMLSVSCGNKSTQSSTKNVFGADDREAITTTEYPWTTIGRVVSPNGGACTGTLVAKDLVLTAAHCIIDPDTKAPYAGNFQFQPNFKNGTAVETYSVSHLWWGTNDPDQFRRADWAIIRIDGDPGSRFGGLGVASTTVENFPAVLTVAGYSSNFMNGMTAGIHHNCTTKKKDTVNKLISHDCDTSRGSSGGPVLRMLDNKLTVYGINVAERRQGGEESLYRGVYDEDYANIAIPTVDAAAKLREILGL